MHITVNGTKFPHCVIRKGFKSKVPRLPIIIRFKCDLLPQDLQCIVFLHEYCGGLLPYSTICQVGC